LFSFLLASSAFAAGGFTENRPGGYTGPGPGIITVKEAMGLRDDANVALRGHIVQHLGKDKYLFKDDTGSIRVEIDHDKWEGQSVGPTDPVEIIGEIDKDWNSVEIDVDRVIKR
jgi:uncharacterized protein (TIGR00156 family)